MSDDPEYGDRGPAYGVAIGCIISLIMWTPFAIGALLIWGIR